MKSEEVAESLGLRKDWEKQDKEASELHNGEEVSCMFCCSPLSYCSTVKCSRFTTVSHVLSGGVVHGPKPKSYSYTLPKKVRRMGLRVALSCRFSQVRELLTHTGRKI